MKRYLLLLALASISSLATYSTPRSKQQALQIAEQLLDQPQAIEFSSSLYIYNNEEKPGFAIVSGSDKLRPVIGYSETGTIDPENMPENLTHWLHWVEEATQYLEEHPECALTESQLSSTTVIAPLLGNIAWGQDYPFNAKCPDNSVVGCVATAAAQCVYYHRYPTTGVGTYTNASDASQTVKFSQVTYNYNLMFDNYSTENTYTSAQVNEVAKLSYHCGVICDMEYGQEGSSASIVNLRRGLVENFNYDPYCQMIFRASHTYDEWQKYLVSELEASRPVIFAGSCNNASEGHCFVIDGVDAQGLYHVNWGWNGYYDGYYDVTILNPEEVGIGADVSTDGFCSDQSILIQLAPKGKLSNPTYFTSITAPTGSFSISTKSLALGNVAAFSLSEVYNYSNTAITGKFGLAFVQNGTVVQTSTCYGNATTFNGASTDGVYGGSLSNASVSIPKTLSAGTYQVYACFIPSSGDFENECGLIYCKATSPSYYTCTVSNGKVSFSQGSSSANVSVCDWNFESGELTTGTNQTITCSITNNDNTNTLVGKYYLYLTSPSSQSAFVEADEVLTLAPNATGTLSFQKRFSEAGQWKSTLYIFYQNIDYDVTSQKKALSSTTKTFTVVSDGTTDAALTLLAAPTLICNESYGDSLFIGVPAYFNVNIQNSGAAYTGQLQMQFFKSSNSTTVTGTITGRVSIPANSAGSYTIAGNLVNASSSFSAATSGTAYYARAYYLEGDTFKIIPSASDVSNRVKVYVYAGSPTGIESLHSDSTTAVCTDLFGRRATSHSSGILIRNGRLILQK